MTHHMPISTSPYYDTNLYEPITIVNGMSAHAISALRGLALSFTSILGGKQSMLEKKFNESRNECLKQLIHNALKMKADMIIDLEILDSVFLGEYVIFMATGTALKKITYKNLKGGVKKRNVKKNDKKNDKKNV